LSDGPFMKIAVFSDVHGNYDAFQNAMSIIHSNQVDAIFFLGDVVGYYYESLPIIEQLMKMKNLSVVLGNHDQMFLEMLESRNEPSIQNYTKKYGSSLHEFVENANLTQIEFLASIPTTKLVELDGIKFMLLHGGPTDPLHQRVYPDTLLDDFQDIDVNVVFLGHTHYRMNRTIGFTTIINPGSLGQPRDSKAASFVIYDTQNKEALFVDVAFDVDKLKEQIHARTSEPSYLIDVLDRQ
jgi:putative phosphoesterase